MMSSFPRDLCFLRFSVSQLLKTFKENIYCRNIKVLARNSEIRSNNDKKQTNKALLCKKKRKRKRNNLSLMQNPFLPNDINFNNYIKNKTYLFLYAQRLQP